MRYFLKLVEAQNSNPPMVMQRLMALRQFILSEHTGLMLRSSQTDTPEMKQVDGAKQTALAMMQMVGGSAIETVMVHRIPVNASLDIAPVVTEVIGTYLLMLNARFGNSVTCGDETITMFTNEAWWVDASVGLHMTNKSPDDLVFMTFNIRIDA